MEARGKGSAYTKMLAVAVMITFAGAGCAASGGGLTDTGKGAIIGSAGGAGLGAIIAAATDANPVAGLLIGAAGGALVGGVVGHFMDERKKDLEKDLAPQINSGAIQLQMLKGNALLVTMTGLTAFAPGSSVVNSNFFPTMQTIANVVKTYGKTTLTVIGHPDAGGTIAERASLANQRAEAVRNLFIGMGVPPILVTSSGNPNSNYMDGRVEVVINPLTSG